MPTGLSDAALELTNEPFVVLRGHPQTARRLGEAVVSGPEAFSSETDRREEVHINPPQTAAHQGMGFDEREDLPVVNHWRARKAPEQREDLSSALQRPACELSYDERMTEHQLLQEETGELPIGGSQMVDPDGRIDQDHAGFRRARVRRRGTGRTPLSEPPNAARRRALSRATRASRPARTTAVFSRRPLSCVARRSKDSSILRVVRICISMPI